MINNTKQMNNVLQHYILKALQLTRDELFYSISNKIVDFYHEPVFDNYNPMQPEYYKRTGHMLESLSASNIEVNQSDYKFTIGFDRDYLTFRYPRGFSINRSQNTSKAVTGFDVLQWMNNKSHGGTVSGEHSYWDESIEHINQLGGLNEIFKRNCKKVGLPIK